MTNSEFFLKRWEMELPAFGRVLRAVPTDTHDYKPHERSASGGGLAWQLVEEQRALVGMMDTGDVRWEPRPQPKTTGEIVAAWDESTEQLRQRLTKLDEEKAAGPARFFMGGEEPAFTDTVGGMLWSFLFDMVHHRGQLSAYLRPMGGKVPSIYGPSADDNGQ